MAVFDILNKDYSHPGRLAVHWLVVLSVVCQSLAIRSAIGDEKPTDSKSSDSSDNQSDRNQLDFFETRIRPVLDEHCYSCHSANAKNVRGGLLLDSMEGTRKGGDSGPAVVPGQPENSLLISALRHESFQMPPDRKLPDSIVKDFEKWISDGATDPRAGGKVAEQHVIDLEKGRTFWCFRPLSRPDIPDAGKLWARNEIDHFVADVHQSRSVVPAEDASPQQLIRRLCFVLHGLPPTTDQTDVFVAAWNQNPETAMQQTVDRLLASHHFGERWGRHWLDVARFAESSGGGRSLMYPDAWRYRDYVIRSFNQNKRFDQFVREQIAGDLLPFSDDAQRDDQITGAGYLILGAINYEEQDKEALRMDVVDEQIDSMGRTFLGMTLGCARCHDHKFDPIPTADYYALAGIFRSTKSLTPGNVSGYVTANLKAGYDKHPLEAWQAKESELQQEIRELRQITGLQTANRSAHLAVSSLPGTVVDETDARFTGDWVMSRSMRPWVGDAYRHSASPRTGETVTYEVSLSKSGMYSVRVSYNAASSRSGSVPVIIEHADGQSVVRIDQRNEPGIDGVFEEAGQFRFDSQRPAVVTIDAQSAAPGFVIVDAVQFRLTETLAAVQTANSTEPSAGEQKTDAAVIKGKIAQLKTLEESLKSHQKKKPVIPQVMCVEDESAPSDWHIHVRGGIRNHGPVVPRGFLSVALPQGELMPVIPATSSGRLQLADWLVSADNPMTARVFVNRVWMHIIGEGIVRTPDNFGSTGQLPTHPKLLDYLASEFVNDDQWAIKTLVRRICLSRTFRMASAANESSMQDDPDNLLLTRGFRRRLDSESIRDSILMISGQLDLSVAGGSTIREFSTYDNTYSHEKWPSRSRSVYVPFFRNSMLDLFFVFDIANSNLVTGRRTNSTLPSQALYMMNSPFVVEQARLAAENFLSGRSLSDRNPEDIIRDAWRLTLGREPDSREIEYVNSILSSDKPAEDVWAGIFHALFASVDFRYLD